MNHELSPRQRQVLEALDQLTQLSSHQLKTLLFHDVSREAMRKHLNRLREDRLIKRVGVRASPHRGGAAPGVWLLTEKGYFEIGQTNKTPRYSVNPHTLIVADLFVGLVDLDRQGGVRLLPETDVEHSASGFRVDLNFDGVLPNGKRRRRYIEVQRTIRKDTITQKIAAHWNAFRTANGKYPKVIFVVTEDYHAYRIKRLIPTDQSKLFEVVLADDFVRHVTTP